MVKEYETIALSVLCRRDNKKKIISFIPALPHKCQAPEWVGTAQTFVRNIVGWTPVGAAVFKLQRQRPQNNREIYGMGTMDYE